VTDIQDNDAQVGDGGEAAAVEEDQQGEDGEFWLCVQLCVNNFT